MPKRPTTCRPPADLSSLFAAVPRFCIQARLRRYEMENHGSRSPIIIDVALCKSKSKSRDRGPLCLHGVDVSNCLRRGATNTSVGINLCLVLHSNYKPPRLSSYDLPSSYKSALSCPGVRLHHNLRFQVCIKRPNTRQV